MRYLRDVTAVVTEILTENKQTRNSDSLLYLKVLEYYAAQKGLNLKALSVHTFLTEMSGRSLPPFETVRRNRQKVQAHNPELAACEKVKVFREQNEKEVRKFALNG